MKSPVSYAPPRRLAAKKKQFRLQLRRSKPAPEEEPGTERKSHFWKWVALVALLHLLLFGAVLWTYRGGNKPLPPEQFINLVPEGDVVKGDPGQQQAAKLGNTTPAPAKHQSAPTPEPTPVAVKPPPPMLQPTPPKPVVKVITPSLVADKPVVKPPPVKPKVKVDISHDQLVDNETTDKPVKPKPVKPKKHVSTAKPDDTNDHDDTSTPDNTGLTAAQVAKMLGDKVNPSGVKNSVKIGPSGAQDSTANPFGDFYRLVHDQVMDRWANPNLDDPNAVNPVVQIHVEADGRVPAESVVLIQSSGNPTYDDSALAAARGLGQLREPLPVGCPPDMTIHFKLTR